MNIIVILIFVAVFAVVALPMVAVGLGPSQQAKQVKAALDSALATERQETREHVIDFRKEEQLSSIPWLNRKLRQFDLAPYLHRLLSQAELNWSSGRLLAMSAACAAIPGYLVYLRWESVLAAMLAGVALGTGPFLWVYFKRSQRFGQFEKQLPDALELMVSALRAGHSLNAAMGLVARECPDPVGVEFKGCFEEQNYGLELKTAMDNMLVRVPLQDLRVVTTAIMIQKESGGNLAEVLDKTSYVIRERFRLRRQVMIHTAQGRMTGLILTCMPLALGVALYLVNPDMVRILWTRPIGIKLLWGAGGMTVLGGLIIRNIVNMEV